MCRNYLRQSCHPGMRVFCWEFDTLGVCLSIDRANSYIHIPTGFFHSVTYLGSIVLFFLELQDCLHYSGFNFWPSARICQNTSILQYFKQNRRNLSSWRLFPPKVAGTFSSRCFCLSSYSVILRMVGWMWYRWMCHIKTKWVFQTGETHLCCFVRWFTWCCPVSWMFHI